MMKQVKTLLVFIAFLCCNIIGAQEVAITLYSGNDNKDWAKDKRSITLVPTATIDGNTINVYTNVTISGLQMSIKDSMGNIVYSNNSMEPSRYHTFEVYDLPIGEYILEIEIGNESFYGYLSNQNDI